MGSGESKQHEYIIETPEQRAQLRQTLAVLKRALAKSKLRNEEYFEFEWNVHTLKINRQEDASLSSSSRFADPPRYRVLAGEKSHVIGYFLGELLSTSEEEFQKIRSIVWYGTELNDIMQVAVVQVVEGDIPVPSMVSTSFLSGAFRLCVLHMKIGTMFGLGVCFLLDYFGRGPGDLAVS